VSPANPQYAAPELAFQLKDTGAQAPVAHASSLAAAHEAAKIVGLSEDRIILVGEHLESGTRTKHFDSISGVRRSALYRWRLIDPKNDVAFLLHSSGTTSLPKGVMLTHKNIMSNVQQRLMSESPDWKGGPDGEGDKIMGFLPFITFIVSHTKPRTSNHANSDLALALTLMLNMPVLSGLTLIIIPSLHLENFCSLVQEHRATFAYLAPPVDLLLEKDPIVSKYDLSSLQMVAFPAAPLSRELADAMYERIE
jgi:4-coumarate--CoA ligase